MISEGKGNLYLVGSERKVEIDGTIYTVRVTNNTTPDECNNEDFSQTACGFVIEFVDIVENRQMNSLLINKGGWPATLTRMYANDTFFNKLPDDLQKAIIDTKVVSGHGSIDSVNNISIDKIYLLSAIEVNFLLENDAAANNTRTLDYYTDKNRGYRIKKYNGSYASWWLRTPDKNLDNAFVIVYSDGGNVSYRVSNNLGFAPAFRIG